MLTRSVISKRVQAFLEERRSEPRFFTDEEVVLVVDNRTHVARVADRSSLGLGVAHTCELHAGDTVRLLTPTDTLTATVVWSKEHHGSYRSGLRIVRSLDEMPHTRGA